MDIQIKKKLCWATLLSVIVMAFLLLKVDWDHFSLIASRVNAPDFLLAFLFLFLANFVRSYRFYILDHVGNKLSHWWIMNQVYNIITVTLPGGPGEAVAAYVLKKFSKFNMFSAIRIFFLTRLMDLAGFSGLLLIAAALISGSTPYREAALLISGIVFFLSLIVAHPKSERFILRLLQRIPLKGRLMNRLYEKLEDIAQISEERFSGALYGTSMFHSALMAVGVSVSVHFVLSSLGTEFTLLQSLYCFGVFGLFQLFPVHGIAGIGTQTAWWALSLKVAGYNAPDAIAMAIVLHGAIYVLSVAMGLLALLFWLIIRNLDQS